MDISTKLHDFRKTNIITITGKKIAPYDNYRCQKCGCEGKRYGLSEELEITKKGSGKCVSDTTGQKIRITGDYALIAFGWDKDTDYEVVKSPLKEYKNDVWVYSELRKEPVRLLSKEYIFINQ